LLDAALGFAMSRSSLDPDKLSLELAFAGITRDVVTLPGLCEAARRFGRLDAWHALLRYFAGKRESGQRPRPFESWFELDIFLCLVDFGYQVSPQQRIGPYRVDMLLPDFVPKVVVECDGDAFHGEDRRKEDEVRERWLQSHGYRVLRFRYSDFLSKPGAIKRGLKETLESLTEQGLQLRLRA
jgi:very-short-patch-repair endonuclease